MLEPSTVNAFLEPSHHELAARMLEFATDRIAPLGNPDTDDAARDLAQRMVPLLAEGGCYRAIADQDWRACCIVREQLAYTSPLADAVFALQALGTTPLMLSGNSHPTDTWVEQALDGKLMTAFAMTETIAGSDVAALATTATRDGDAYVLNGSKTFISNAGIADLYVVFATIDASMRKKGITAFAVPAGTPGLKFTGAQVMSAPHPLGDLRFTNCRVPEDARLSEEGAGLTLGFATLERLRPTVGAAACGLAARALTEAKAHARTRQQFGKSLSDFQLIKQKLARMATDLDAARLLVYRAAYDIDRGAEKSAMASAMAKAFATEAAQRIVDDAVQILGGQGVLADHPVDHLYRSVRALRIYEGTTEVQQLIIAGHLLAKDA